MSRFGIVAVLALLTACDVEPAFPSLWGGRAERELPIALPHVEIAFIGRVRSVDNSWYGPSGALRPSAATVTFEVNRVLRGELPPGTVDVKYFILGTGLLEERSKSRGFRLSPRFFRVGKQFLVFCSHGESMPGYVALDFDGYDSSISTWEWDPMYLETVQKHLMRSPFVPRQPNPPLNPTGAKGAPAG